MPAQRVSMTYSAFTDRVGRGVGLHPVLAFKQPTGTEVVVVIIKVDGEPPHYETWEVSA